MVLNPFSKQGLTPIQCVVATITCALFAILIPVLSVTVTNTKISNSACIALGCSLFQPYSFLYAIINTLLFSCISCVYLHLVFSVYKGMLNVNSSVRVFKQVAVRLGLVILTNFLASMTVTVISVLSLSMYMPPSLEAFAAFNLFSVNSCINPLLNTITLEFLKESKLIQLIQSFIDLLH